MASLRNSTSLSSVSSFLGLGAGAKGKEKTEKKPDTKPEAEEPEDPEAAANPPPPKAKTLDEDEEEQEDGEGGDEDDCEGNDESDEKDMRKSKKSKAVRAGRLRERARIGAILQHPKAAAHADYAARLALNTNLPRSQAVAMMDALPATGAAPGLSALMQNQPAPPNPSGPAASAADRKIAIVTNAFDAVAQKLRGKKA